MAYRFRSLMLGSFLLLLGPLLGSAQAEETLLVASTTSTEQSGLFGWILPRFEQATGIKVRVVAVGTGQALDIGRRGDADALLVHDRPAEDKFVAEGYGSYRKDVMYNDFVFVGPKDDPAGVRGTANAGAALKAIAGSGQPFVSRGDKSGTHAAELRLWKDAGIDPKTLAGYKETGSGMGPTLNMAAATGGYALSDRATWYAFKNRSGLDIVLAGDPVLFNPYGVIPVNPARHSHVKKEAAERFAQWLTSPAGQEAIAAFRADGQQVFFPSAKK
ncbi:substrate-binding domain-containing protein [Dechloromonas sp. XY25]|uniref:Substrate-binding domain-containing protein n=1 Tax=Dechloromonas hankyongensis TaxID=2908002 RepID=A0ABS9K2N3_9RHOO|nr:substrate-binding domain-containing protein [Dechloromonas hankyongensis]MCG2577413.1 substrate-binding domain-containing protein [Dechloromonas hankyongensis]